MNSKDGLLLWVLGGAGILFLYSAWSKQHPAAVLGKTLGTGTGGSGSAAGAAGTSTAAGPAVIQPLAPFRSRLAPEVPDAYAGTPTLYIPGTWNA